MIDVDKIKPGDWIRDVHNGELAKLCSVTKDGRLQIWNHNSYGGLWSPPKYYTIAIPSPAEALRWFEKMALSVMDNPVRYFEAAEVLAEKGQALLVDIDSSGPGDKFVAEFKKALRAYQCATA